MRVGVMCHLTLLMPREPIGDDLCWFSLKHWKIFQHSRCVVPDAQRGSVTVDETISILIVAKWRKASLTMIVTLGQAMIEVID